MTAAGVGPPASTGKGPPHHRGPDYIERAERYAGRRLERREDLSRLIGAARDPEGARLFDELLFLSKFCDRAIGIVRRTGPGSEEVSKLTGELASATERITGLIDSLITRGVSRAGGESSAPAVVDHASFAELRLLIGELAILKNFELHEEGR